MSAVIIVFLFLVILLLLLKLYFWLSEYLILRDFLGLIPGPRNLLFIGNSWQISAIPKEDRFEWFNNLCFQYPLGMVVIWLRMQPFVNIRKPQQIEVLLSTDRLITKSKTYEILKSWLENGLLTSRGNKWYFHRHVVKIGFEDNALRQYIAVIYQKTDVLIKQIDKKSRTKSAINMFSLSVKYAFDATCLMALGIDIDTLRKSENTYTTAINDFYQIATERYLSPYVLSDKDFCRTTMGKKMLKSVKILHGLTESVLRQKQIDRQLENRRAQRSKDEKQESPKCTFVDHILSKNEYFPYPLSFQEIRQELDTFLFMGFNTVSSAISWALFSLGNTPEVQKKLREELYNVLGETEKPSIQDLKHLHYLDRVMKEVFRLYPSLPVIGRSLDSHAVIDDFYIPKGTTVNIQIYQLHRDPEIWEDAETFNPDRFLPEKCSQRHSYAYIPFSSGSRQCIGENLALLEVKIVLSIILRKWQVSSLLKPNEIKMTSSFCLKPHDNRIEIFFTPINNI